MGACVWIWTTCCSFQTWHKSAFVLITEYYRLLFFHFCGFFLMQSSNATNIKALNAVPKKAGGGQTTRGSHVPVSRSVSSAALSESMDFSSLRSRRHANLMTGQRRDNAYWTCLQSHRTPPGRSNRCSRSAGRCPGRSRGPEASAPSQRRSFARLCRWVTDNRLPARQWAAATWDELKEGEKREEGGRGKCQGGFQW